MIPSASFGYILLVGSFVTATCQAQNVVSLQAPWKTGGQKLTTEYVLVPSATYMRFGRTGIIINRVFDDKGKVVCTGVGDYRLAASNKKNIGILTVWWSNGGIETGTLDMQDQSGRSPINYRINSHNMDRSQVGVVFPFRSVRLKGAFAQKVNTLARGIRKTETEEFFKRLDIITR